MSAKKKPANAEGQLSPPRKGTPRVWRGWKGGVVHPQAPDGGGGPGFFREARSLTGEAHSGTDLDHPGSPQPLSDNDPPKITSPRVNDPPKTKPTKDPIAWLEKKEGMIDVKVTYQILADKKDESTVAETTCDIPKFAFSLHDPEAGKPGKFTWKGTIDIQTAYSDLDNRKGFTCYGRGTTPADLANGDITLGFHEACHRTDFETFITDETNHPRPELPVLTETMTVAQYTAAKTKFTTAFDKYEKAMKDDTKAKTDEVGKRKSTIKNPEKDCFQHILPPEDEEEADE